MTVGLRAGFLGRRAAGGGGGGSLTVSTLTVGLDTVSVNTVHGYTPSGLTVGEPVFVVIAAYRDGGFSSRDISSVTIGGVAATKICATTGQPWAGGIYFIDAAATSSDAVSVTFSANMEEVVLGHFQITGTTQTTYSARTGATPATSVSTSHTTTPSVSIPSGGVGIAYIIGFQPTSAATWTDNGGSAGSELLDMQVATGSGQARVSVYYTDVDTTTTYTATFSTNTTREYFAFTWGP